MLGRTVTSPSCLGLKQRQTNFLTYLAFQSFLQLRANIHTHTLDAARAHITQVMQVLQVLQVMQVMQVTQVTQVLQVMQMMQVMQVLQVLQVLQTTCRQEFWR